MEQKFEYGGHQKHEIVKIYNWGFQLTLDFETEYPVVAEAVKEQITYCR
jgi:hypothetical protein